MDEDLQAQDSSDALATEGVEIDLVEVVSVDADGDLVVDDILVLEEIDTTPQLPVWEPTGDPAVDAALEELATLDQLDRAEHVSVYESVHRRLHDRLADLASGS